MTYKQMMKAMEASRRQAEREENRRQKELKRQAKEAAKLSALEQARLEVDTYENCIEVLLSIHKECGEKWDWRALASNPPPVRPVRFSHAEYKARRNAALMTLQSSAIKATEIQDTILAQARRDDDKEFAQANADYDEEYNEWKKMRDLAMRIISGDCSSYLQALSECSPLSEIGELGSSMSFTAHNSDLLECELRVNGTHAIPAEIKSLTASGKVSLKKMPKARFHEIYQDYVCGCALRVAREVFALLPVKHLLLTASVVMLDARTGRDAEQPILSVIFPRDTIETMFYARLDPSDAMENFIHNGNVKISKKTGDFEAIIPLAPNDVPVSAHANDCARTLSSAVKLREDLKCEARQLGSETEAMSSAEVLEA